MLRLELKILHDADERDNDNNIMPFIILNM